MALLPLMAVLCLSRTVLLFSHREVTFFEGPGFPLTLPWSYKLFLLLLWLPTCVLCDTLSSILLDMFAVLHCDCVDCIFLLLLWLPTSVLCDTLSSILLDMFAVLHCDCVDCIFLLLLWLPTCILCDTLSSILLDMFTVLHCDCVDCSSSFPQEVGTPPTRLHLSKHGGKSLFPTVILCTVRIYKVIFTNYWFIL